MISDNTFHCNPCDAPACFDDHDARLRHLLQQDAPPAPGGGRHLLLVCPICRHAWYKAGKHEYPRLTPEQLATFSTALHVDLGALYQLPRSLCPICSAVSLGGMFSIEEYPYKQGYRFLWESASSRRTHLVAMLCRRSEVSALDLLVEQPPDILTASVSETLAALKWLETRPFPATLHVLSHEQCVRLAHRLPAGNTSLGTPYAWQGYAWQAACPPMGGETRVVLAVALPKSAPAPFISLHASWTVLARAMRAVL